jgi:hypothetical protein
MIIKTEDCMTNTQTLIAEVYSAFNQRNIDDALGFMRENVSWPKASEGGRVIGIAGGLPGESVRRQFQGETPFLGRGTRFVDLPDPRSTR